MSSFGCENISFKSWIERMQWGRKRRTTRFCSLACSKQNVIYCLCSCYPGYFIQLSLNSHITERDKKKRNIVIYKEWEINPLWFNLYIFFFFCKISQSNPYLKILDLQNFLLRMHLKNSLTPPQCTLKYGSKNRR